MTSQPESAGIQISLQSGRNDSQTWAQDEKHFCEHCQQARIPLGMIEVMLPNKSRSGKQRYQITQKGRTVIAGQNSKERKP